VELAAVLMELTMRASWWAVMKGAKDYSMPSSPALGGMIDLGTLSGISSDAVAINSAAQIVRLS